MGAVAHYDMTGLSFDPESSFLERPSGAEMVYTGYPRQI